MQYGCKLGLITVDELSGKGRDRIPKEKRHDTSGGKSTGKSVPQFARARADRMIQGFKPVDNRLWLVRAGPVSR